MKIPDTMPAGANDLLVWDDDVPGFAVRLRAGQNGVISSKTFVFQYGLGGRQRKQRRMVIGRCTAVAYADAKRIASELYSRVRQGDDPQGIKFAVLQQRRKLWDAEAEVSAVKSIINQARRAINEGYFRNQEQNDRPLEEIRSGKDHPSGRANAHRHGACNPGNAQNRDRRSAS